MRYGEYPLGMSTSPRTPFDVWVASKGGPKAAAQLLGVSREAVSKWRTGERRPRPEHAALIERVSEGAVPRDSLLFPEEQAA